MMRLGQFFLFQDSHFIYSFSPVPGPNKLFIRLAEVPTAKVSNASMWHMPDIYEVLDMMSCGDTWQEVLTLNMFTSVCDYDRHLLAL